MKSVIYFRAILCLLLCSLFFSCENDIQEFETRQAAVTSESVSFSVSSSTKSTDTHFMQGDLIGVYAVERLSSETGLLKSNGNYADNKCFRYNGTTFEAVSTNDQIIFPKDKVLDFYVYYPYTIENTETSFSFHVQPDQREYGNYMISDLLMATFKEGKSNEVIHLEFIHKMALVEAILNTEDENKVKLITIKNRYHIGVADLTDTSYFHKTDPNMKSDIQMLRYFDDGQRVVYRALMPCQSVSKDDLLFEIKLYNGVGKFMALKDVNLLSGAKNCFDISLQYAIKTFATGNGYVTEGGIYTYGQNVLLLATPYPGFKFEGWFENNLLVWDHENYSFNTESDRVLEARFSNEKYYKVIVYTTQGGTVYTPDGDRYKHGDICTFIAKPYTWWEFVGWFYKNSNQKAFPNAIFDLPITSDMELEARFRYLNPAR